MKYCAFCGKPLENGTCSCPEAIAKASNNGAKKKTFLFGGLILIVVLIVAAIFALASVTSKVDPFNYLTVKFDGYNSNGVADINFDTEALIEAVIGEEPVNIVDPDEALEWYATFDSYNTSIDYTCSQEEGLSNGDAIVISVIVSGSAEDKITSGEKTFTVEGLTEVQTRDIFEDITVSFSGLSGDGTLELDFPDEDEVLSACKFNSNHFYGLSLGDVVTVSVSNIDEIAENYGVIVSPSSKEYVVSGLSAFITDPDLLSKDIIKTFIENFLSESEQEDDWLYSYSEPRYYGTYFCAGKHEGFMIKNNMLRIFICYDEYFDGELRETVYLYMDFANLTISPTGEIYLTYDMGVCDYYVTDIDAFLEEMEEDYTITPIQID